MDLKQLPQYELVEARHMKEFDSMGTLLRHKKSGARLFLIENKDNNKVFNIAFRTPTSDSTGVPHIIEHTVLCGSDKYPAHDPFIELAKGSLNTYLNAMTYPDKTMYPVASTNDKDFSNLMSVYMDAVFHPNIGKTEMIFRQEGWHYELEKEEDELSYNGVVYNEMKGAFSSADDVLERFTKQALYPDTPYAFESGGDPAEIVSLSYENYLAFYNRYYHPSNSYIYLYGDMDMEKVLAWMDEEYLSHYDKIDPKSEIALQKPFDAMRELNISYSITEAEKEEAGVYFSWNKVVGTALDAKKYLAFQILDYVLLNAPGAHVKQALLDAKIGRDIYGGFEEGIYQLSFNVTAKDANEEDKERFVSVLEDALRKVAKEGINRRSLLASINSMEFKLRESDFGRWPRGLMLGLQCFDSWLYDENDPFLHLEYEETLSFLKEQIETGYFEKLISDCLLDNAFGVLVTANPVAGLAEKQEEEVAGQLRAYKESLSHDEVLALVEQTKALREYQETETPPEILEMIPMLSISDIKRGVAPAGNELRQIENSPVLFHDFFTSGISYVEPVFDASSISLEDMPYLSLLKGLLGTVNTKNYSYREFADEINISTGGIAPGFFILNKDDTDETNLYFSFRIKSLHENLPKAMELLEEMMFHSDFSDDNRLLDILGEASSRGKESLQASGHTTAVKRAISYISESGYLSELTGGYEYYLFIDDLYRNFEEKKELLREKLDMIMKKLFVKSSLLISYTSDEDGYEYLKKALPSWLNSLEEGSFEKKKTVYPLEKKNEGISCSSQVQYVARVGNFKSAGLKYHGSLRVLQNILNYDYLWKNLREKGGAYGCMSGFGKDGDSYLVSYRDPHLTRTNEVYNGVPDFIRNFSVSDRDMTKFIIGAISESDIPLTPSAKGLRGLQLYLRGTKIEELEKTRAQILDTTVEDIRALAGHVEAILADESVCVVGNAAKIKENEDFFGSLTDL